MVTVDVSSGNLYGVRVGITNFSAESSAGGGEGMGKGGKGSRYDVMKVLCHFRRKFDYVCRPDTVTCFFSGFSAFSW